MPKSDSFKNPNPKQGDSISAGDMGEVIRLARQHQGVAESITVGGMLLSRITKRPEPNIIYAYTVSAVSTGAPTFDVDNITLFSGLDPRADSGDAGEVLEDVKNTFMAEFDSGELVRCEQNLDGEWEALRPGTGGSSGSSISTSIFSAKLTSNKGITDGGVEARLVDENGVDLATLTPDETVADETARLAMVVGAGAGQVEVGDFVKQADTDTIWRYDGGGTGNPANWTNMGPASLDVIAIDKTVNAATGTPVGLYGLTDYVDYLGGNQDAFLCEVRNAGIANYGMTGKPGYEIISMEGLAASLLVQLNAKPTGSLNSIDVDILDVDGANYCHRLPPSPSPPAPGFFVYDDKSLADNAEIGDIWYAVYSQKTNRYYLRSPAPGLRSLAGYDDTKKQEPFHDQGVLGWEEKCSTDIVTAVAITAGDLIMSKRVPGNCAPANTNLGPTETLKPSIVVRIQAGTSHKLLAAYDSSEISKLPVAIGSNITVLDTLGFGGLKQQGQDWHAVWSIATQNYQLTNELTSAMIIRGEVGGASPVAPTDTSFPVTALQSAHGRLPVNSSGATLSSVTAANKLPPYEGFFGEVGDAVWLVHDLTAGGDESTQWRVLDVPSNVVAVIIENDVTAASGSLASFTAGTGSGKICSVSGATYTATAVTLSIHNFSNTAVRASSSNPLYLWGVRYSGILLLGQVMDFSGLPDFDSAKKQRAIHDSGSSAFKLVEECELDVVTKVEISGGSMFYTKHPHDSCVETDVPIIDTGPCST